MLTSKDLIFTLILCRVLGSNMAIFRNFILTLSVVLKKNTKINLYNRITSKAALSDCFEVAVLSHPCSKMSQENSSGRDLSFGPSFGVFV